MRKTAGQPGGAGDRGQGGQPQRPHIQATNRDRERVHGEWREGDNGKG